MTRSDDKAKLEKLAKLVYVGRELLDKLDAVVTEVDAILGGRAGIGEKLKKVEGTFEAAWSARYGAGLSYVWNYGRDRGHMKRLIRTLGVDDLEQRMQIYLQSNDAHIVDARHNFPMFVATINAHLAAPLLADGDGIHPVVDCKHRPRCASEVEHTKKRSAELRA